MLKLPTLIALFICFVNSNNEHNADTQLDVSELQLPTTQGEGNKNSFHTIKGQYTEEKKKSKPCKQNKNRRLGDTKDTDLLESLPLTATTEQINTGNIGDKVVTSSIHGAHYNNKNEHTDEKTDNSNLNSKKCDCNDCVLETNKKILQFESLALDNKNNPLNNAPFHFKTGESESADSNSAPFNNAGLNIYTDDSVSSDRNDDRLNAPLNINNINNKNIPLKSGPFHLKSGESESADSNSAPFNNAGLDIDTDNSVLRDRNDDRLNTHLNMNTIENAKPCNKGLNSPTRRRKCGKIDLSENVSTTPTYRRILPGITENPNNQESEDEKLYQDSPQSDHNDEAESRQSYFPNVQKVSNSYGIDLVHNMNINEAAGQSIPIENPIENQLIEPTRGKGIYDMKDAGVMLLENSRVCYACSTMSDPTCWTPDRRTTVKYCRKGHQSCLTKSFKHRGKTVIIRDCGSQCVSFPNGEESYSSCSICHSDVCNGASSMSIGIAIIVFGIFINT